MATDVKSTRYEVTSELLLFFRSLQANLSGWIQPTSKDNFHWTKPWVVYTYNRALTVLILSERVAPNPRVP